MNLVYCNRYGKPEALAWTCVYSLLCAYGCKRENEYNVDVKERAGILENTLYVRRLKGIENRISGTEYRREREGENLCIMCGLEWKRAKEKERERGKVASVLERSILILLSLPMEVVVVMVESRRLEDFLPE